MNRNFLGATLLPAVALLGLAGLGVGAAVGRPSAPMANGYAAAGWGIDACISCHVPVGKVPGYLRLLRTADIPWLRERSMGSAMPPPEPRNRNALGGPNSRAARGVEYTAAPAWRLERRAGFRVVAFASTLAPVPVEEPINQLPENLLEVYRAHAEAARAAAGDVAAWEMVGEPDAHYCRDLPDRTAAYQKAVYLALKAGEKAETLKSRKAEILEEKAEKLKSQKAEIISEFQNFRVSAFPAVLSGGLAFPPGPWLELAAANGLFDYTDAMNVHHYGFAEDLGDVIAAHREVAARWTPDRDLPVWVTEAGLLNVAKDDWRSPAARAEQAAYILECARQSISARAAVFMPFILTQEANPYAMTESSRDVYPAWNEYRDFTRRHRLNPGAPAVVPPSAPNPVVLQWLPDAFTCTPSKVTRSYWFDGDEVDGWMPLDGTLFVYNFGDRPVRVRLVPGASPSPRLTLAWLDGPPGELVVPPMARGRYPLEIALAGPGYFRGGLDFVAETLGESGRVVARSAVRFFLETPPNARLAHAVRTLALHPVTAGFSSVTGTAPYVVSARVAPWLGINGVRITTPPGNGTTATFDVREENANALSPPVAIAALPAGLPAAQAGFLRVRARDERGQPAYLRVDLVDDRGQRFTIVENLGRNPRVDTGDTVLLGYADFHPWVFGRIVPGATTMDPARVREIQLRFTGAEQGKQFQVDLDVIDFLGEENDQKSANHSSPLSRTYVLTAKRKTNPGTWSSPLTFKRLVFSQ